MNQKPIIYKEKNTYKNNNMSYCYLKNKEKIEEELEKIYESLGPLYEKKVIIETIKGKTITYLKNRDKSIITTIDNKKIPIEEILSIKRIS